MKNEMLNSMKIELHNQQIMDSSQRDRYYALAKELEKKIKERAKIMEIMEQAIDDE